MPSIRRCRNEHCECNVDGIYCDAVEVELNEDGVCETFCPKLEVEDGN